VSTRSRHELDHRVSQTFLRHYDGCPRSGLLYAETREEQVKTVEMVRGAVAHAIYERGVNLMLEHGEPMVPPDLFKVLVDEALAEQHVPLSEHDFIREQAWRWATEWAIDVPSVAAVERLFTMKVDGWAVRCKVDYAEVLNGGQRVYVADYKTGRGAPRYEDIARKRPDRRLSPKSLQLVLYALALVYGRPVVVTKERCLNCASDPEHGVTDLCASCAGSGFVHVERPESDALAPRAQEIVAEFVYPAIENSEGRMLRRRTELTRIELDEYRESLRALIANVARSEQTGDWPAIVSDDACQICPAAARCPIPTDLREDRASIQTLEDLRAAAESYFVDQHRMRSRRAEIKAATERLAAGRLRYGADRVWEYGPVKVVREIPDKDALWAAVEAGRPVERAEYERVSETTPFLDRALSAEELEQEEADGA
jgi:PD-(D/E)XK nuclease superfamily